MLTNFVCSNGFEFVGYINLHFFIFDKLLFENWYTYGDELIVGINLDKSVKKITNKPNNGEFDPGSGLTLAACLTHASQGERPACGTIKLADG